MAVQKPVPASSSRSVNFTSFEKRPLSRAAFFYALQTLVFQIKKVHIDWGSPLLMTLKFAFAIFCLSVTSAMAAPTCNTQGGMSAVDISQPITTITTKSGKSGTDAFKVIGVKTIARYYDWPEEGIISCRVLLPAESDAIIGAGLNIISIFQNGNDDPETFIDPSRGKLDANQAIKLAQANGQPAGSAIYFAVDGVDQTIKDSVFEYAVNKGKVVSKARRKRLLTADPTFRKHIKFYERFRLYHKNVFKKAVAEIHASDILPLVEHYFRQAKTTLAASGTGYKIGVYGSGATCAHLQKRGLVDYCWLAMSTGWPGFNAQIASGKWNMAQQRTTFCKNWKYINRETVHFDFNKVNSTKSNLGQWSKKGPVVPMNSLPETCQDTW
jgi:Domain of unknown function (DUF1906)